MKWSRILRVGVLGAPVALGVAAGWMQFSRTPPIYEAYAKLQVRRSGPSENEATGTTEAETSAVPHTVLLAAAESATVRQMQFAAGESPAVRLASHTRMVVERQAGQDEYSIFYATEQAAEAIPVLTAVVDAFTKLHQAAAPAVPSPALVAIQTEVAEADQAIARQQQVLAELQQKIGLQAADETRRTVGLEQAKLLGGARAEACRRRLESENRFAQAQQDFAAGVSVELFLARLPEGETRPLLEKQLTRARTAAELEQAQIEQTRLAGVYGRNHPKMIEAAARIDELKSRLESATTAGVAEPDPAMVLRALQGELAERQACERDLQEQLDVATAAIEQQAATQESLDASRRELARLEALRAGLRERAQILNRPEAPAVAAIEPPTLQSAPVSHSMSWYLLAGGVCGTVVGGLLFWQTGRVRGAVASREGAPIDAETRLRALAAQSRGGLLERRRLRMTRMQPSAAELATAD